jgi:hypothetical protein
MVKYFWVVYFFIITILLVSCAPPKYSIKYDVDKTDRVIPQLSNSKIGILLLEDNRPQIERTGKTGFTDTFIIGDEFFDKSIPVMVAETMQQHLKSYWNNSSIILENQSNNINIEFLDKQKKDKYNYILIGSIDHFTQRNFDEHYTARTVGAFLSGLFWPLAPILFPVSVAAGNVQKTTEIDLNKLILIKSDGPQVMWQGQCKTSSTQNSSPMDINEGALKLYTESLKKVITCVCENISLSSEMDFPKQLSIDHSKKLINHIEGSKSLNNLNY